MPLRKSAKVTIIIEHEDGKFELIVPQAQNIDIEVYAEDPISFFNGNGIRNMPRGIDHIDLTLKPIKQDDGSHYILKANDIVQTRSEVEEVFSLKENLNGH